MNIFDHIIPDNAILGIGPLFMEESAAETMNVLYGRRRYFFELHLVAHTTMVRSEWFHIKEAKEQQQKMKEWREQYFITRQRIATLIGETNDQHKERMEKAHELHMDTINLFSSLVTDLVKQHHVVNIGDSIKRQEQKIYDNLLELKMMASN